MKRKFIIVKAYQKDDKVFSDYYKMKHINTKHHYEYVLQFTKTKKVFENEGVLKSDVIVVSGDFVEKRSAFLASYPLSLPALFIKAFTKKGDYVLDPFAGTGTTGYACRKLGRHFILIEINRENINVEKLFNYKPKKRT